MSTRTHVNVLFFGPPGVGKGTQAALVASQLHLAHVSTGELFRYHVRENTPLGQRVDAIMKSGAYVPDEITVEMLSQHLISLSREQPELRGVIFDGFPRTVPQTKSLDAFLAERGEQVDAVIYLDAPQAVLVERITSRGRADDTADAVKTRLTVYATQTEPLLARYQERGTFVARLNGDDAIAHVTAAVVAALAPFFSVGAA